MSEFAFQKKKEPQTKVESEEIKKIKDELEKFYSKRRMFLILGLVLIFVGIGVALIALTEIEIFITLGSMIISGGIVMFILRSALFNTRIRNRKERIAFLENENQHK